MDDALRPEPDASGRGLSASLPPSHGNATGSAEALWTLRDMTGPADKADAEPDARLDAERATASACQAGRGR